MTETIVHARCMLLFGPWAEVEIPERDYRNPVRVAAAELAAEVGVPERELPGKRFEVAFGGPPDDPVLSGWRLL